jgi:PBP1b-binding outer membrane lipoprotein LpoB
MITKEEAGMKRLRAALGFCIFILMVAGCASINYNEIAPNANSFKPKVAVVLPAIKMPEGADQEADKVAKAIYDAAVATKHFERIIDPVTAKSQMSENSGLQDAVMSYTTKLRSLGVSDKEAVRKIGEIYQADTVIVGDVSKWGYTVIAGEKAGEVGIAIKMADAETGAVYWKAAHASRETYSLFKPNLSGMATDLAKKIFGYMPKSK